MLGPLKNYLKNEAAKCKITRFYMGPLTGFAWSKAASVAIGISAFESKRIYPSNRQPEYLFSISATCDTITSMEIAHPIMALVCVPSTAVITSQNVLPLSAEHSLHTLSIIHPSDIPIEEITASIPLKNMSPVPKTPRKYSIEEMATIFLSLKKLFLFRKRETSKEETKSKSREIEGVNSPNTLGLQSRQIQRKK